MKLNWVATRGKKPTKTIKKNPNIIAQKYVSFDVKVEQNPINVLISIIISYPYFICDFAYTAAVVRWAH